MTYLSIQQQEHHHHYRERNGVDMALVSAPDCDNYTYGVLIDGPVHNVTWIPGVTWPDNSRVCMDRVTTTAYATASITQEKEKIGEFKKLIFLLHLYVPHYLRRDSNGKWNNGGH